jgi:Tfp pilus assembly protein PilZ
MARRIEIRFWRRGSPQQHNGFSVDVSKSGIFLGTLVQLEPGERIRLELVEKERNFIVEGQVARVHRVSLALRHLEQQGVGVRFLSPAELVQELLGNRGKPAAQKPVSDSSAAIPIRPAQAEPAAAPAASPVAPASAPSKAAGGSRLVTVEFVDRTSFLNVYHRDIASGGLFVTTTEPAQMHEIVSVELRPPIATQNPLRFEARVVHCVDGAPTGSGSARGVGVQFLGPDRVRAALAPIVLELRR